MAEENGFLYYLDKQAIADRLHREQQRIGGKLANLEEALALVRQADEALARIEAILTEMSGLAACAALEETVDRVALNRRFQALKTELDRCVKEADYGGFNLLDGTLGGLETALKTIEDALGLGKCP